MLDSECELLIAIASQIKITVTPCVEFGCAAQCLSGPGGGCTLFGVVDNDDGDAILALQLAQMTEKRSDLSFDGVLGKWSFAQNGDTTLTQMSGRQVKSGKFDDDNAVILK